MNKLNLLFLHICHVIEYWYPNCHKIRIVVIKMKSNSSISPHLNSFWVAGQPFVYFDYNAAGDNIRVYSSLTNDWERIYAYDLLGRRLTYTEGELVETLTYNGMNLSTYRQRWQESGQIRNKTTLYHYTAHRLDSVTYDDAISKKIEFHLKES